MAGTLTISTLSDGTNSTSSTNCIQGSAKAWVTFNPATGTAIVASYNVSSITKNSVGDYTVSFTNALSDANYAALVCGQAAGANRGFQLPSPATKTTTQCELYFTTSGATIDPPQAYAAFFR